MDGAGKWIYGQQHLLATFKLEQSVNGTVVASVITHPVQKQDDVGALYYVVAVLLIYGCSILLIIASYIRKNDEDRRLKRYVKEIANVRKLQLQKTLLTAVAKVAASGSAGGQGIAARINVEDVRPAESAPWKASQPCRLALKPNSLREGRIMNSDVRRKPSVTFSLTTDYRRPRASGMARSSMQSSDVEMDDWEMDSDVFLPTSAPPFVQMHGSWPGGDSPLAWPTAGPDSRLNNSATDSLEGVEDFVGFLMETQIDQPSSVDNF